MQYQGRTQQQWLDLIAAYTVDTAISILVPRVVSGRFMFKGQPSYATLTMENKPMLDVFEAELVEFKADETSRINAIFAEMAAEEAFKLRFDAIRPFLPLLTRLAGYNDSNLILLEKRITKEQDEDALALLESFLPIAQGQLQKDQGITLALSAIEGGKRIVAYMNALNAVKNPTSEQVKAVLQDPELNLIKLLLESGSLNTAKTEIEAYTPTGIITESDKTAILAELNAILSL